ncbi:terminase gpA endonuclease subunit [Desulforhopalus singaporensis]|uniref:Phage terminase, large subunit GpA n=1 Tax=Desulforhopalus singaporensis TaxID=91360 RepID=A0A1H0NRI3_9BACT|nr:terminase gpA endonuclease subunit [Desulforhopalus singaporensis]SDO95422.1 Phage terminase, large subunit GpA [Desulforhopalus singaporensis]
MAGSLMKMEVTPHVVGQLDAADRPFVRCVVVCAGPQSAKSTMVDSYMGYRMDRAPGPALSVYPDKLTAEKNCRKRIHTMIDMSPRLRRLKTGNRDDITNLSVKLSTMEFLMGWSGSAISLSNESIMLLDLQEVDKYPESPNKKEAGTIEVAETRVIAFPNSYKIFITSTPTTENGPIWQALTVECEVIYDYYAKCPYCGKVQHMVFENIKWPKGDDGHSIDYRDIFREKLAWYECEECSAKWSDYDRNQAIQTKSWYERRSDGKRGLKLEEHLEKFRPAYIGFHQPSWISSRVSLSKVAADWLRIKDPRRDKNQQRKARKNFYNKHKAEAWLEREVTRTDDMLLALKDDRPAGVVPGKNKVAGLVFGADTQDDGFWYSIYAIGYGKVPERWLVQDGFVFSFDDLEAVLWENVYKDTDGNIYPVQFGLLDSMGHRTSEVYDFCDGFPGLILPSKGERTMATPYNYADVEFYPGTEKKKFPGNLKRVRVNTTHYKDKLDGLFRVKAADPGALRFHSEISEDFVFQMLAEERDENGVWVNDKNRANHQWDCGVLALVAADIKGIRFWPTPEEAQQVVKPIRQRKQKQKRQRW